MAEPPPAPPPAKKRYPRVPLATCLVPWRADGTCALDLFRDGVRHVIRTLSAHVYIFGTAGEGHAVTDLQYRELVTAFVAACAEFGGRPMVGVISLSLGTVRERIEFARALGVREFQLSLPAWGALNDAEVDRYFAETCGRFPDCAFLHYNLSRAQRLLTGADYARLVPAHPNLVAIKMGGEHLPALREVAAGAAALRCFFTEFAYVALREETDCGLLCAVSAGAPELARRLFAADAPTRRQLEPTLRALHAAAKRAVAPGAHMDGAYDKLYLRRHLPGFPLRLLPPYASATEEAFVQFCRECDAALAAEPAVRHGP